MTEAKTKPVDDTDVPTDDRKPYKDIDGNVIDAPTIPAFERELREALDAADEAAIADIHERYHKARDEKVKSDNANERKARKQEDN